MMPLVVSPSCPCVCVCVPVCVCVSLCVCVCPCVCVRLQFPFSCLIGRNGAWVIRLVSSSPSASYFEYHESPYCPLETCLRAAKSNIDFFKNNIFCVCVCVCVV
eukprot:GHVR01151607.1.p2 GENE.GHVR01151607.1~~GHVR01151607.1.p2  ORF type:complete len:104 (-),score=43.68 GHVR01151607.1:19-330(-)